MSISSIIATIVVVSARPETEMRRWELSSIIGTGATASIALAALIISETNSFRADMNSGFDRVAGRFTTVDSRFTTVDSRFITQDARLEERFLSLENKLESRFNSIDGRLTTIERDVADLRERAARIDARFEYLLTGSAVVPE